MNAILHAGAKPGGFMHPISVIFMIIQLTIMYLIFAMLDGFIEHSWHFSIMKILHLL